jgi:large subunit ribosomal protein L4
LDFPRAKARLALVHALSAKQAEGALVFVDSLGVDEAKTKAVAALLKSFDCGGRNGHIMMLLEVPDAKLARASRNIPNVELALAGDVSAYSVLRARRLLVTKPALEKLQARCACLTDARAVDAKVSDVKAAAPKTKPASRKKKGD